MNSEIKPIEQNTNPKVGREPRPVEIVVTIKVKNVQADSFERAKEIASDYLPAMSLDKRLSPSASRECDGTYTVEFR